MHGTPHRRSRASLTSLFEIHRGQGPLLATSLHDAHEVRESLLPFLALSDADRLREEDPFTGQWTTICPNRILPRRSRFEVDLNRPPAQAVYRAPSDAWGLTVWRTPLPDAAIRTSMHEYRAYYAAVLELLEELEASYGKFVVLDLHSYNHRRAGAHEPPAAQEQNPDINVGTGSLDRSRFGHVVDRFITDLRAHEVEGRPLDVRENVRFQGGYLCRWVHEQFPVTGCVLAIEVKKFFMDEWTGEPHPRAMSAVQAALAATIPGLLEELTR